MGHDDDRRFCELRRAIVLPGKWHATCVSANANPEDPPCESLGHGPTRPDQTDVSVRESASTLRGRPGHAPPLMRRRAESVEYKMLVTMS